MKTLFLVLSIVLCARADGWRVERYGTYGTNRTYALKAANCQLPTANFSWLPRITPGWPLRGGKWLIKWEGTF